MLYHCVASACAADCLPNTVSVLGCVFEPRWFRGCSPVDPSLHFYSGINRATGNACSQQLCGGPRVESDSALPTRAQISASTASAHVTATADYPSKLKRDRDGNLCRWKPTVGTPANHGVGLSDVDAPLRSIPDVSLARSERSVQRDATLVSAQRADANTADARAGEYDRHLTDLEEYRSGKNKNDVASDGADMAEPQVQNLESGKLLRQRVPTEKELRMGGEFSECVDCDGAMNSSSGSTPFLKGGEIAPSLANQAHFGPPDAAKYDVSVEFASSAQHSASASVQSQLAQTDVQLAQTDVNREYEAVTSLMEMHGSSVASSCAKPDGETTAGWPVGCLFTHARSGACQGRSDNVRGSGLGLRKG